MPILIICQDSKQAKELRQQYLAQHLSYIETIMKQVLVAGPNKSAEHENASFHGSTFLYKTDSLKEALALFNNDPYTQHGVYQSWSIQHFTPAAGTWLGGKTW